MTSLIHQAPAILHGMLVSKQLSNLDGVKNTGLPEKQFKRLMTKYKKGQKQEKL